MRDLSLVWYPTFRCNLKCAYCASRAMPVESHGQERKPDEWQDLFMAYPYSIEHISVTGGEPTLYRGLADVLLATEAPVCLDTNLRVPLEEWFLPALAGQMKALNCGLQFHPEHSEAVVYWERLARLRDLLPNTHIACCHVVLWRDPEQSWRGAEERAAQIGVEYRPMSFDDTFLYRERVPAKEGNYDWCDAGRTFGVLLPDGAFFRCLGHAYYNIGAKMAIGGEGWGVLDSEGQPCDRLLCTTCDTPGMDPVRHGEREGSSKP